jgi:quinol monooxygenase YgiN
MPRRATFCTSVDYSCIVAAKARIKGTATTHSRHNKGKIMKKISAIARSTVLALLVLPILVGVSISASAADKVIRIVVLTATSADAQQKGLDAIGDSVQKAYKAAKGMESVTFFADPTSLATGSASVWASREDLDAFLKSPAYLAVLEKLKPFMKGAPDQKIYKVTELKK